LPEETQPKALPIVLFVHGGPWWRDFWGFNPTAQWLANRGYAVLQVNYRASTGSGKKFFNAGNKQWGLVRPSNLKTLLASIPPYWKAIRGMFDARMGNSTTQARRSWCAMPRRSSRPTASFGLC
jgi:hypothetical protein